MRNLYRNIYKIRQVYKVTRTQMKLHHFYRSIQQQLKEDIKSRRMDSRLGRIHPFPYLLSNKRNVLYPTVKNDLFFNQQQQQEQQEQHEQQERWTEEYEGGSLPEQHKGTLLCLRRKSIVVGFSPGYSPTATIIPKKKDKILIRRCSSQTTTKPDKPSKFLLQSNHSHKFQPYVKPVKKPMNALFGDIPTQSHDTFDYGAHILDDETVFSEFDWITTHTPTNHLPLSPPLSPSDSHESFMLESLDDYVLFP
ncbi:uncharacterized protein EV154DRAFT_590764 [Mucor mucedo]|uniref:uncharacterized protein n=1 Tax=Mucor mucedo TaxID=29922 RepID=UPI00221F5699|nr:uncharacterized protein EV154DRAFT_590764 [Mucor mucedo]KAI7896183.1 hypothetical protein EV154DRAFT_590764 [Mucor mucedo]